VQRSQLSKRLDNVRKSLSLAESSAVVGLDPNSCQVEVNRIASDESARYILIKSQGSGSVDNVMDSDTVASDRMLVSVTEDNREVNTIDAKLLDTIHVSYDMMDRSSDKALLDDSGNESSIDDIDNNVVDITGDKGSSNKTCDIFNDKIYDEVGTTIKGADRNTDIFADTGIDILDMANNTNNGKVNSDDGKLSATSEKDASSISVKVDTVNLTYSTSSEMTGDKAEASKDDIISDTVDQDSEKGEAVISAQLDLNDSGAVCIEETPEEPVHLPISAVTATGLTSLSIATTTQPTAQSQNTVPYSNAAHYTSPPPQPHLTNEVEIMSDDTDTNSGRSM